MTAFFFARQNWLFRLGRGRLAAAEEQFSACSVKTPNE
jgi:hypothetical protein